jgi:hypothetical protein
MSDEIERLNRKTDELLARIKKMHDNTNLIVRLAWKQLVVSYLEQFLESMEAIIKMNELIENMERFK